MMVGAMKRELTFLSILISIFLVVAICLEKKQSVYICNGIVSLLILQNFCIGVGAHLSHNSDSSLKLLTQIPFISIFIIWFFTCVLGNTSDVSQKDKMRFVILLVCIGLSFFIGRGGVQSAVISIRNMTAFFMIYEIGAVHIKDKDGFDMFSKHIICWGCLLCLVGIILLIGGYPLYKFIGIHEVYVAKAAPFTEGYLDYRFYTSLFSSHSYVRMGSLLYEPINLAYIFSIVFLCSLFNNPYKGMLRGVTIICNGIGLFLTFGKGGYLIAGLGVGFVFAERIFDVIRRRYGKDILSFGILIIVFSLAFLFVKFYIDNIGLAVLNHVWGVIGTWKNVLKRPWGYGIGTGGNVAHVLGNSDLDWLSSGGETAFMSFMFQIGIQGIIAFSMCLLGLSQNMKNRRTLFERLFFYIPFILLGISILQDNTFTPQCITVAMLLQGALSNKKLMKYSVESQDD